jgi:Fe2+ or Zn2+ uptake regulation protein
MTTYLEFVAEDRRLAILRLLADQGGYSLNDSVLTDALDRLGHRVPRDTVRSDLQWLQEVGALTTEMVGGRVLVATLSQRGHDCSLGRARIPGIKLPAPRA